MDTDDKLMFVGLFILLPIAIIALAVGDDKRKDKEIVMCQSFCAPRAYMYKDPFDDPEECLCKGSDGFIFQDPKEWKR